ncbi:ADC synthase [Lipomyces arxii]|uniref:ADC synthase n=1 Tax=Lipomyces arxii TaxID=56418 RepID=UPI0034CD5AA4
MNILLVDSYDSFTYNLIDLLRNASSSSAQITVVPSAHLTNVSDDLLPSIVDYFDVIVIGPGPGTPLQQVPDMGGIPLLWKAITASSCPPVVFGVCLGFQWIMLQYGHNICQLPKPRHGLISTLDITELGKRDCYINIPPSLQCVRYHSLYADYKDYKNNPIQPLAWTHDLDENGNRVLMAVKHSSLPFWAVQYHPESICSTFGAQTVQNILALSHSYLIKRQSQFESLGFPAILDTQKFTPKVLHPSRSSEWYKIIQHVISLPEHLAISHFIKDLCESAFDRHNKFALLESAGAPGSWSYIGFGESSHFTYVVGDTIMHETGLHTFDHPVTSQDDAWHIIASRNSPQISFVQLGSDRVSFAEYKQRLAQSRKSGYDMYPTFHGGVIGFISYESGVVSGLGLSVESESKPETPDISLAYYTDSIAINHNTRKLYIHKLAPIDVSISLDDSVEKITSLASGLSQSAFLHDNNAPGKEAIKIEFPDKEQYVSKIIRAQKHLELGDSYELCVTDQTVVTEHVPPGTSEIASDWTVYNRLKAINPAPYSSFLMSDKSTLVGLSPERFLRWDENTGMCELRPIKGTVPNIDSIPFAEVEQILTSAKERSENLMIVDLIRHDLAIYCDDVRVPQLMGIETYRTVHQLVSVVSGKLKPAVSGIDVLLGSLPPGSMTGAPKRRSVEILQELENHRRRGPYSGVHGYWDVVGHGDWSVVIRSAYSVESCGKRQWKIGAGGAITALSDPDQEWDEMRVKLYSALRYFQASE